MLKIALLWAGHWAGELQRCLPAWTNLWATPQTHKKDLFSSYLCKRNSSPSIAWTVTKRSTGFYFLYHWFINDSKMTFAELSQCSWILCSHCLDKIEGAEPAAFDPTLESPLSGWGQSQRMSQSHLPASRFRKYWCIWMEILSKSELSCFCKIHLSIWLKEREREKPSNRRPYLLTTIRRATAASTNISETTNLG